jgi:hypothetical protein
VNWQAIGAIGEVVGAIAVVATLLYLARDIRQNSRSLAISALRDTTANWNQWGQMVATSGDLADIVVRGNRALGDLSESEALRYGAFVQSFFDNVEAFRSLVIDHHVDRDLSVLEAILARRLVLPGYQAWWRENTDDYSPGFIRWVEQVRTRLGPEQGQTLL